MTHDVMGTPVPSLEPVTTPSSNRDSAHPNALHITEMLWAEGFSHNSHCQVQALARQKMPPGPSRTAACLGEALWKLQGWLPPRLQRQPC